MRKCIWYLATLCLLTIAFVSCQENDATFDKYQGWKQRNAAYFEQVADSARQAIAAAKAAHGADWEKHCQWRMYQNIYKVAGSAAKVTDSICVKVLASGTETGSPMFTDTVRVHYRGMLMPTKDVIDGRDTLVQDVFDYSFVPPLDQNLAFPQLLSVSGTIVGFSTALQYMHRNDRWLVYIPQNLGYGDTAKDKIPAHSTLLFDLTLVDYYAVGEEVPNWH